MKKAVIGLLFGLLCAATYVWSMPPSPPPTSDIVLSGNSTQLLHGDGTWSSTVDPSGGTGLTDPNANRAAFWDDDTDNGWAWVTIGSGLTYTSATHTLTAATGGDAAPDNATKGLVTFLSSDFTTSGGAGHIGLNYGGGQNATSSVTGFLSATDWTTFNNKQGGITRPVTGPTPNPTAGNVAVFGATGQLIADGGTPQSVVNTALATPGAIGGTTPAAATFTKVEVTGGAVPTTGMSKDGSNNLTLCDAVVGTCKTLTQLVTGVAGLSNLPLGARQIPGSIDGLTVQALNFDKKGVWAGDNNTIPSELAIMDRMVEDIGASFDGGGSAIAANKIAMRMIDYNATITGWTVLCDQAVGASGIDFYIYKDQYSNSTTLPTTDACATGTRPGVAATTNLAGQGAWDCGVSTITAGDMIQFKVKTAPAAATWCNLSLKIKRR